MALRGDITALERVRDRLRDMPADVCYDQHDATLGLSRALSIPTPATYCACIAGVAVAELCFGGDYEAALAAFADLHVDDRAGIVFDEAATALKIDDEIKDNLFMTLTAEADDAAGAVQRAIDAIKAGDEDVTASELWPGVDLWAAT